MTVKSDRNNAAGIVMLFICAASLLFMTYILTNSALVTGLCGIPLVILLALYWVSTGRTLTMDENGCTIRFLWFKKLFRWEDLQEKSVADYKSLSAHPMPYHGGVVFATKRMKRIGDAHPIYYSALRPFSSFYVYFHPEHLTEHRSYVKLYTVKESDFREKMSRWGIVLDGEGAVERTTAA